MAISYESGEGEARFASQNTYLWTHSRPKMAIPYESGESAFFLNDKTEYFCSIFGPRDAQVAIPYESGEGEGNFAW